MVSIQTQIWGIMFLSSLSTLILRLYVQEKEPSLDVLIPVLDLFTICQFIFIVFFHFFPEQVLREFDSNNNNNSNSNSFYGYNNTII